MRVAVLQVHKGTASSPTKVDSLRSFFMFTLDPTVALALINSVGASPGLDVYYQQVDDDVTSVVCSDVLLQGTKVDKLPIAW